MSSSTTASTAPSAIVATAPPRPSSPAIASSPSRRTTTRSPTATPATATRRFCRRRPPASRPGSSLLANRLPLLFQGEEYGETNPFPYFCDFESPELIEGVRKGRAAEFAYFGRTEEPPDPVAASTRDLAVLSWSWEDDPTRSGLRRLYRDLLRLRRESPTLRDFRHGRSRVVEPGDVLEVVRGGVEPNPTPPLRIFFNLSAEDRSLPDDLASELPAFRSEVAEYGAPEARPTGGSPGSDRMSSQSSERWARR